MRWQRRRSLSQGFLLPSRTQTPIRPLRLRHLDFTSVISPCVRPISAQAVVTITADDTATGIATLHILTRAIALIPRPFAVGPATTRPLWPYRIVAAGSQREHSPATTSGASPEEHLYAMAMRSQSATGRSARQNLSSMKAAYKQIRALRNETCEHR